MVQSNGPCPPLWIQMVALVLAFTVAILLWLGALAALDFVLPPTSGD